MLIVKFRLRTTLAAALILLLAALASSAEHASASTNVCSPGSMTWGYSSLGGGMFAAVGVNNNAHPCDMAVGAYNPNGHGSVGAGAQTRYGQPSIKRNVPPGGTTGPLSFGPITGCYAQIDFTGGDPGTDFGPIYPLELDGGNQGPQSQHLVQPAVTHPIGDCTTPTPTPPPPTATPTQVRLTPTATVTPVTVDPTPTPTVPATATMSSTPTKTPTPSATPTGTLTPTTTASATSTLTSTSTPMPTSTATSVPPTAVQTQPPTAVIQPSATTSPVVSRTDPLPPFTGGGQFYTENAMMFVIVAFLLGAGAVGLGGFALQKRR